MRPKKDSKYPLRAEQDHITLSITCYIATCYMCHKALTHCQDRTSYLELRRTGAVQYLPLPAGRHIILSNLSAIFHFYYEGCVTDYINVQECQSREQTLVAGVGGVSWLQSVRRERSLATD